MKKIIITFVLIISINSIYSIQLKKWVGKLNDKGKLEINFKIPIKKIFFLQAFFFYKENWRPIKIFFNEKVIWTDLGKKYKDYKYIVHLFTPK